MKTLKNILILILTFSSFSATAQDVEFSQFYATKNYLNPAFTSLTSDHSFSTTFRNQWPGIENAYNSYFVSYDRCLRSKDAGVGVYYLGDLAGEGALLRQSIAFQYAKHLRLSKKLYASYGIKGSYNSLSIRWDRLVWGDMLDARRGIVAPTNQQQGASNVHYFDAGTGFIVHSDKFQGGIALEHINRPKHGLLSLYEQERIPIRYKMHLGGNIPFQTAPNAPLVSLSPQMIYTRQGAADQLALGAYLTYTQFTIGAWHRLGDSMIILVGMKTNGIQIGYSYDMSVNNLMARSGGAHEISLSFGFDRHSKESTRKYKTINCPVF